MELFNFFFLLAIYSSTAQFTNHWDLPKSDMTCLQWLIPADQEAKVDIIFRFRWKKKFFFLSTTIPVIAIKLVNSSLSFPSLSCSLSTSTNEFLTDVAYKKSKRR